MEDRQQTNLVAIDVGTSKVCTFVARVNPEGRVQLLGYGITKSEGIRKGIVVDMDLAQEATSASILEAQRSSGTTFNQGYVGFTGDQVVSKNAIGNASLDSRRPITTNDLYKAQVDAGTPWEDDSDELLHVIPLGYTVDGQACDNEPIGMHGGNLLTKHHVISMPPAPLRNLKTVIEGAGIRVQGMVLEPIASGEAVLTDDEMQRGVAIIDIGGGTSDIALFHRGKPIHTTILPIGGHQITNDIALMLGTPYVSANDLKMNYGGASPKNQEESIRVPSVGAQNSRTVSPIELNLIIRARINELFHIASQRLSSPELKTLIPGGPAGLVITGGTSHLQGIARAANDIFRLPVRLGSPEGIDLMPESLNKPEFAAASGMLLWAKKDKTKKKNDLNLTSNTAQRITGWMRNLLKV